MKKNTFKFVNKLPANSKRIYEAGKRLFRLDEGNESIDGLVSIITVCLNASCTIQKTINSVLSQTYPDIEHIIVDGCSTDETLTVLQKNIGDLEYVISEPDEGLYQAMNKGISLSRGEYVLILNADDWYEPETVEFLVLAIKYSYADFVSARTNLVNESGVYVDKLPKMPYDSSMYFGMSVRHELMLLPRKIYAEVGRYNQSYHVVADFDLTLRLFDAGYTFFEVPKYLLNFRVTGVSSTDFESIHREHSDVIKGCFPYVSDRHVKILANEQELTKKLLREVAEAYQHRSKLVRAIWAYSYRRDMYSDDLWAIVSKSVTPDISVIIPVYNSQNVISRCIQSILREVNVSIELLVVEDKSTDESFDVLRSLSSKDSRIRLFQNSRNLGAAVSRNFGIKKARGKYVFFVDSDDEIPFNALSKLYASAIKNGSKIVKGNMAYFSEELGESQLKGYVIENEQINVRIGNIPDLLKTTDGHVTCLYEAGFIKNNLYPENLSMGEDSLFVLKAILMAGKVTLLPIVVYHYIYNNESAMNSYTAKKYIDECSWRLKAFFLLRFYNFNDIGEYLVKSYWNEQAFSQLTTTLSDKEYVDFANSYIGLVRETKVFPDKDNKNISKTVVLFKNIVERYGSQKEKDLLHKSMENKENEKLKLVILTTAITGGAGIAAKRLFDSLQESDTLEIGLLTRNNTFIGSSCFSQDKIINNKYTNTWYSLEEGLVVDCEKSISECEANVIKDLQRYDVINIHWNADFTSLGFLKALVNTGKPIIFTLHDYWMFTGGCHYPAGCQSYFNSGCLYCPQIKRNEHLNNLVRQSLEVKHGILNHPNVFVTAPSGFLLNELRKCSLNNISQRTYMVRNPYVPLVSKIKEPRKPKSFVLICGSHGERRKGFDLACEALQISLESGLLEKSNIAVVGEVLKKDKQKLANIENITYFGKIYDYSEINYIFETHEFVLQSSFEDNWSNVLVEAGVAGCIPVVTPNHGCEEFAKRFGVDMFISDEVSALSYAATIGKALNTPNKELSSMSVKIREMVCEEHLPEKVAMSFQKVISKVIAASSELPMKTVDFERRIYEYSYYVAKLQSMSGWRVQENELSFLATVLGILLRKSSLTIELYLVRNISGVQATTVDIAFISHKNNSKKQVFSLSNANPTIKVSLSKGMTISIFTMDRVNVYGIASFDLKLVSYS